MRKQKPLTKDDLLETLAEFYQGHIKPEFESLKQDMDKRFGVVDKRFNELNNKIDMLGKELNWARQDVMGLTGELSKMVTMKEFNKLKGRVDRYHPSI